MFISTASATPHLGLTKKMSDRNTSNATSALPQLTFFCELEPKPLTALFSSQSIFDLLARLRARVSLGLIDFTPERAAVVRRLNAAGIPVVAWMLLPKDQGYWLNASNAPEATDRYIAFKEWSTRHDLHWAGVGLDIEPDIDEFQDWISSKGRAVARMLKRLGGKNGYRQARSEYERLVARMRTDGYPVQSYELPFIADDLKVGSTLLQRLTGLLSLPSTEQVLMLYSSFIGPRIGPAILGSYASDAPSIAVGITGGGVKLKGMERYNSMGKKEFFRDLRLVRRYTDDIHIFSLEGCVQQGFLAELIDYDWDRPGPRPSLRIGAINWTRKLLHLTLWVNARPIRLFGGVTAILLAGFPLGV